MTSAESFKMLSRTALSRASDAVQDRAELCWMLSRTALRRAKCYLGQSWVMLNAIRDCAESCWMISGTELSHAEWSPRQRWIMQNDVSFFFFGACRPTRGNAEPCRVPRTLRLNFLISAPRFSYLKWTESRSGWNKFLETFQKYLDLYVKKIINAIKLFTST